MLHSLPCIRSNLLKNRHQFTNKIYHQYQQYPFQKHLFYPRYHSNFAQVKEQFIEDYEYSSRTIFNQAWKNIVDYYGIENIKLPRELLFLMGAPGSGKGTHTPSILRATGIKNQPIGISQLLKSPECKKLMDQGLMVSDAYVLELMLHAIIQSPHPETGILIDGFPRTPIQAELIHLLHDTWSHFLLSHQHHHHQTSPSLPLFKLCVLHVDEEISVQRQLERGKKLLQHNQYVKLTGHGQLIEERATDLDEKLIRQRYSTFQSNYSSLLQLSKTFPLCLIDASGTVHQVQQSILKELCKQNSFNWNDPLYDTLSHITFSSSSSSSSTSSSSSSSTKNLKLQSPQVMININKIVVNMIHIFIIIIYTYLYIFYFIYYYYCYYY
ncbi:unnamed protein product [Cunninghamella echinulata]